MKNSITLTVLYEDPFWVGIFERQSSEGYSVARTIFGAEPTNPEVYIFVLKRFYTLHFSEPFQEYVPAVKKKNPKRLKREAKATQSKNEGVSKAYDTMRIEMEKNKKLKKQKTKDQKDAEKKHKFSLKQQKKKQKLKGH